MISATMPIRDMKNPSSCIPELAILFPLFRKVSLPWFFLSPVLKRWRNGAGADRESEPGAPLSGTGMRDVSDVGARWVRNYHNRSCMQLWGNGGGGG